MRNLIDWEILQEIIIQSPANIIVATQIILEDVFFWKRSQNIQLSAKQRYIFGCNCVPGACHSSNVIQDMAFRLFKCTEIWNNFFRSHDNLSEKKDSRAHDLADHTHHTYDCVNLWQVAAVCSKLLPDIRNCIETYDVNTLVCQI